MSSLAPTQCLRRLRCANLTLCGAQHGRPAPSRGSFHSRLTVRGVRRPLRRRAVMRPSGSQTSEFAAYIDGKTETPPPTPSERIAPDAGASSGLHRVSDALLVKAALADAGGLRCRSMRQRVAGALAELGRAEPGRVERSQVCGARRATARGAGRRAMRRNRARMDAGRGSGRSVRASAGAGVIASHALREGPAGRAKRNRQSDRGYCTPFPHSVHSGRAAASVYRHGELLNLSPGGDSQIRGERSSARSQVWLASNANAGGAISGPRRFRGLPHPTFRVGATSFPFRLGMR